MHRTVATVLVFLFSSLAAAIDLEKLVQGDPEAEAERAFAAGDRRHIILPVCGHEPGEVIPGWPLNDSPEVRAAMENGKRPISCNEIGDIAPYENYMRATRYAERYNRELLRIEAINPE